MQTGEKARTLEVGVFLLLFVPPLAASLFQRAGQAGFAATAILSILNDLALLSLIFYFLWRNGESPRAIGWDAGHGWWEAALGLLLFFPVMYGVNLILALLEALGLTTLEKAPSFLSVTAAWEIPLALVLITVVAVAEETIFRGYLLHRFVELRLGTAGAVFLSSAVFSIGHGYQGTAGMAAVFCLGVLFSILRLQRNSLVAPITVHFLIDFSGIILTSFLGEA